MEGLSQELIAIIVAAIALAGVIVPGVRALRREIGEVRVEVHQAVADLDQRLSAQVGVLRKDIEELRHEVADVDGRLSGEVSGLRAEIVGLRADVGELRNQVSELRERMARVEGLFEGFTRSEPALGTGSA